MPRSTLAFAAMLAMLSPSCSQPGVAARNAASPSTGAAPSQPGKTIAMSASKPCGKTMRERTTCMIELILADVRDTYREADGGGIARITGHSSTSYTVALPQEERVDLLTYEFEVSDTAVSIKSRTAGTEGE